MSRRFATFFILCILVFCLCGCGEDPEKYREDIMIGQWIIPGDEEKVCEFKEAGICTIDGSEYSWKYKKNLLKNLRVDIFRGDSKAYELQVFEAEDQGYRYMMNIGTPNDKKYEFDQKYAGFINLNHYEMVELNKDNYEEYFTFAGDASLGELQIVLKPEYEKRIKEELSDAVFDVIYGQADFFVTGGLLEDRGNAWGCELNAIGINKEEQNSDPVLLVGQVKGILYFDMLPNSAFPVKQEEN